MVSRIPPGKRAARLRKFAKRRRIMKSSNDSIETEFSKKLKSKYFDIDFHAKG